MRKEEATATPASMIVQRRIEWSDTDASGWWHNTAAIRILEAAETALMDRLGLLSVVSGRFPRVHLEFEFKRVLSFRDIVDAVISVQRVGRSSVTFACEIRKDGQVCAEATVVAALLADGGAPRPWSREHKDRLLGAGPQAPELLSVR